MAEVRKTKLFADLELKEELQRPETEEHCSSEEAVWVKRTLKSGKVGYCRRKPLTGLTQEMQGTKYMKMKVEDLRKEAKEKLLMDRGYLRTKAQLIAALLANKTVFDKRMNNELMKAMAEKQKQQESSNNKNNNNNNAVQEEKQREAEKIQVNEEEEEEKEPPTVKDPLEAFIDREEEMLLLSVKQKEEKVEKLKLDFMEDFSSAKEALETANKRLEFGEQQKLLALVVGALTNMKSKVKSATKLRPNSAAVTEMIETLNTLQKEYEEKKDELFGRRTRSQTLNSKTANNNNTKEKKPVKQNAKKSKGTKST